MSWAETLLAIVAGAGIALAGLTLGLRAALRRAEAFWRDV